MLYVIEHLGINMQNELCAALGLARATVSEMLHVLEELGLLERWRARRTKCMMLTTRGERAFDAAYAGCIGNGNVTVAVDAAITRGDAAVDPDVKRDELFKAEKALRWFFGDASTRYDLYAFDWYENLGCFAWPDHDRDWPERDLPWADELTVAS